MAQGVQRKYAAPMIDPKIAEYIDSIVANGADDHFFTRLAGVGHRNDDGTSRQDAIEQCRPSQELELEPEPDNPYDRHAVRVMTRPGDQLGYLDRRTALEVSRAIKKGYGFRAIAASIGRPEGSPCYGMTIAIIRLPPEGSTESTDLAYLRWLRSIGDQVGGERYTIATVREVQYANKDESSRQNLLSRLATDENIGMKVNEAGTKIVITNAAGQQLGCLGKSMSDEIMASAKNGHLWDIRLREVRKHRTKDWIELRVGVYQISLEWSNKARLNDPPRLDIRTKKPHEGEAPDGVPAAAEMDAPAEDATRIPTLGAEARVIFDGSPMTPAVQPPNPPGAIEMVSSMQTHAEVDTAPAKAMDTPGREAAAPTQPLRRPLFPWIFQ